MSANEVTKPVAPRSTTGAAPRLLMRGESIIAALGAAAAGIILCLAASGTFWALRTNEGAAGDARREQVQAIAQVLSVSAQGLVSSDDLSTLRRIMIEVARTQLLSECRLSLPDGRVVADADPKKIAVAVLAARWASGPLDAPVLSGPDAVEVSLPILIAGRGPLILRVAAKSRPSSSRWQLAAGFELSGAAALAALLFVYRQVRQRVLVLGLIRESLLNTDGGESAPDALAIAATFGPEAAAWNSLLARSHSLRTAASVENARAKLGSGRESRSDLEHACDNLAVGLILVDDTGRIRHANGAAASLLQVKREALNGTEFTSLIEDPAVRLAVAGVSAGGTRRETIELERGQGAAASVLRIHVRPLRRQDGTGSLVTLEDITQQRVAEGSRNAFIAQATHELRAPLTNMRLCLEMALESDEQDPKVMAESFNVLNRETRRLERMVSEMLSVAEIEAGSMRLNIDDVKLDRLIAELEIDYRPMAEEKGIALSFELLPKCPELFADRDRLALALHNLIGNAVKYTPAGGSVTVAMRVDAGQLHIDVTDTGIGISEKEQALVFDRFYRAKDPRVEKITGSGLGLALAREVARLHDGDVTVQSELNKGSTFTLTVKLKSPPARANAA